MIQTIPELFYQSLERDYPDALAHRVDGRFRGISHRELQAQVERLALALEGHGLRPGDRIAILAENGPGWAVTDYACALSSVVTVPVYPTLSLVQTGFILRHSSARWVFCSTADQLAKVLELWPELPELEAAVLMGGDPPAAGGRQVHRWVDLMAEGAAQEPGAPRSRPRPRPSSPGTC